MVFEGIKIQLPNFTASFVSGLAFGCLLSLLLGILIGLLPGIVLGFIVGLLLGLYVWIRDKIQPGYIKRKIKPRFERWSEWVAAGGPFGPKFTDQTPEDNTANGKKEE